MTKARENAEIAVAVALSVVLGLVRIYHLPQGGSITAGSMVPIFLVAMRWGGRRGLVAGMLTGFANFLLAPTFVHPLQFLLDYPIAFAALGLAGFTGNRPALGVVVGGAARLFCHFLSGVVFFAAYAPKGTSPYLYSAVYNSSYMLPEIVTSVFLTLLLLRGLPPAPQLPGDEDADEDLMAATGDAPASAPKPRRGAVVRRTEDARRRG
ncbi:MAG: energy-coupled thiamine transporter ThiT [Armatimonadetes bacterium]|nr:energy-coupled thiamine transporter ThiT [Armatimonadota bacterium]